MRLTLETPPVPLHANEDGVVLVGRTRVTLDTLVGAFLDGATAEEIAQQYDSLSLPDVYAVIGFYLQRKAEVDAYLSAREVQAEQTRRMIDTHLDRRGIRDRLLARRRESSH